MLFFQEAMFLSGFVAILKVFDLVAKFLFVNKLVLYPVATINFYHEPCIHTILQQ